MPAGKIELGTDPGAFIAPPTGSKVEFGTSPGSLVTPQSAADLATRADQQSRGDIVQRGAVLPFGVTRGGDTVLATPEAVKSIQDSFHNGVGTVVKIMTGQAREPNDLSPQELLDLGALASAASLTSFRIRGGPAAAGVSDVTAAGQRLGIDVPRGAVGDGVVTRAAAKVTNAVPVGGAPLRTAAQTALDQLEKAATAAKGGPSSMFDAGKTIETGLTDFAGSGGALSQRVNEAYSKVDALVDPNATADLSNTRAFVEKANANAQAAGLKPGQAVQTVMDAVTRPDGLTYQGVKALRTKVGEWIDNAPLAAAAGVSQGEAKAVYSTLSKDMQNIVETAGGPDAVKAWQAANAEASTASDIRTSLSKVLKTGNEGEGALFGRLIGMAGTGSKADVDTLGLARDAVGDQKWGTVLSAMVEKWGFDEQGNFDPTLFAKQWSKVTPEAKAVLFKTSAEQKQAQALDDIAKVSTVANRLRAVSAPPPALITGALGLSGMSAIIGSLAPQHFGVVAASVLGARVVSNVLAKPEGAAAFAQWARAYEGFVGKPGQSTAAGLASAARGLAYFVAQDQALDPKSQVYLGNYLQGAPTGQPLNPPTAKVPAQPAKPQIGA